jgi:Amt family ammonium transporter
VALVGVLWTLYGYSLAFGDGGSLQPFIGGLGKAFLRGVGPDVNAPTFTPGHVIPELAYFVFQMTFAMITPALIIGAFAERMKFSAVFVFITAWVTLIYFPIAHWVWAVADPNVIVDAATELAAATTDEAKKLSQDKIDAATSSVGWIAGGLAPWMKGVGALDFAGGTVVHINAGIAGFVGALIVGKRIGYGKEALPPHSLTMSMIGASLLWVGWFGFNAGSAVTAGMQAGMAMTVTQVATATAALAWMFAEWLTHGKPTLIGIGSGAVAGLVAITPASGFVDPVGALAIGAAAGVSCYWGTTGLKRIMGVDDALDCFGMHAVGGVVGALLTGVFAVEQYGGSAGLIEGNAVQVVNQFAGIVIVMAYDAVVSYAIVKILDLTIGLRVDAEDERQGLDITLHGEAVQ